jgi:hypothetical protein
MKIKLGINNRGISIGVDPDDGRGKEPNRPVPDQIKPSGFYVYGHYDTSGGLFYVGKGTAYRAWSKERHLIWDWYVEKHLGGKYNVKIIADGMTNEEAEELEAELIAEHGDQLVNWDNMRRSMNFKLLDQYHALRDANCKLIQKTRGKEKTDLNLAVQNYRTVIEKTAEYAFMDFEHGLIGQLLREWKDEVGRNGEFEAIDRLSLCLIRLGRASEAAEEIDAYFACYRNDRHRKAAEKIKRRVDKALARAR